MCRRSVPVMSPGIRSGVNWMRLKERSSVFARLEISSVLASPGTPTSRQWPRVRIASSSWSITWSCPTMTRCSSSFMRACASRRRVRAASVMDVLGVGMRVANRSGCASRAPYHL